MNETIALTGATGFAGRHAVTELLKRGYRVVALAREPAAANFPSGVRIVGGDVLDAASLDRLFEGAGSVIHLAGVTAARSRDEYFRINAGGTAAVAAAARRAGLERLVHVSSLAARHPELSDYAASKRASEEAAMTAMKSMTVAILRPPAIYGPGDRATLPLIKALTSRIAFVPGRPSSRFSLLYAEDFARVTADMLTGTECGTRDVSDGRDNGYDWYEIVATASRVQGFPMRPVFLPRRLSWSAAAAVEWWATLDGKASHVTRGKVAELYHPDWVVRGKTAGLAAPTSFADGFARTLEWYRREGWLPQRGHTPRTRSGVGEEKRS